MRSVGIKELKNRLSEYIRLVSQGETVLVTDRDKVVAEIHPLTPGRSTSVLDAVLAEAVKSGWITPPAIRQPPPRLPVATAAEILGDLSASRDDR
ncbi:MAG: type II toxin-antitoxin system prevent-host-death family antitoxin [Acidobacteriota bacterium]